VTTEIITFGCRLNAYESEAMRGRAGDLNDFGGDTVIVNTCAVTAEAVRQSRQAIRRARRAKPHAKIVVTGCAAQSEPQTYAAMDEVDLVLGNAEKLKPFAPFLNDGGERVRVNDIFSLRETAPQMVDCFEGHTRAFLQVQNGCDHRCTFCIIPYGRGNSRSVPMGAVVEEARRLTAAGYPELVLTGVDLTAYGADLPGAPRLGALVRKLLKLVPDMKRLRLSSIDSIEVDDDMMRAIAEEERLMPHFHLSVQAGDDLILKRMKRRHGRADTIAFCEAVRRLRPGAAFGADLIAGFPTEDEDMAARTRDLIDEAGLSTLHVFPFSPRPGTPAARMPQLDRALIKERAARLRAKGEGAANARLAALTGTTQELLVERGGIGRTRCFAPARIDGEPGSFVIRRVMGHVQGQLTVAAA
jgi:threonylcarbamoyladenosine tRNA methylthiotransferase MtaB